MTMAHDPSAPEVRRLVNAPPDAPPAATRAPKARSRAASQRLRAAALWLHRWVGLALSGFLIIAGLTGSVIAFFHDLDAALNPELFHVEPPEPGARLLDPIELHDRIQRSLPSGQELQGVVLDLNEGESVNYYIDERETFFDPYTGQKLGSRHFGDISEGKKNLLTFIYMLHFTLALGDVGLWLFGLVAVLWTLDCFVGAYLTFPVSVPAARGVARTSWLSRWVPAWLLKTNQLFALVFTWHRASGLWVWGMLLVFAWSAVSLNFWDQVYDPVMSRLLPRVEQPELPELDPPRQHPKLSLPAALERGRALMADEAARRGFRVIEEKYIGYDAERGAYSFNVESTLDIGPRLAETTLAFDSEDGRPLAFNSPTTDGLRNRVDRWLVALHFGTVREGGVVYRAFVCLMGVAVTLLSVTGIWIWWRKRKKRSPGKRTPRRLAADAG